MTWLTVTEYISVSQMSWPQICCICPIHNPVPSWFMTGFVSRVTWHWQRVPHVEQERLTLLPFWSTQVLTPPVLVAFLFCALLYRSRSLFATLFFCRFGHSGHWPLSLTICVVCPLITASKFWMPLCLWLWYISPNFSYMLSSVLFKGSGFIMTF
jgi:hypothetical protein